MIIHYENLSEIRKMHSAQSITFCSGSFDLIHGGHVLFLEEAKNLGDILVVGVGNDIAMKTKGADRPLLNEYLRLKVISSLRPVDYAFIHSHSKPGSKYSNAFLEEIFTHLQPDLWMVNTDANEIDFRKKLAKKYNIKLIISKRDAPPEFENISTTKIIEKIKKIKWR